MADMLLLFNHSIQTLNAAIFPCLRQESKLAICAIQPSNKRHQHLVQNFYSSILLLIPSSPLAKQCHKSSTKTHAAKSRQYFRHGSFPHFRIEHEFMGHELNQTSVDENTSRYRVEDAVHHEVCRAARHKGLSDTQSDGDGDWCR